MESLSHANLVLGLADFIRSRHKPDRDLVVLADHASCGGSRPWPINGFVPDVFAQDLPVTFEVIGEAKTPGDLETERSFRQMAGFVQHLALCGSGYFYLGVPWGHEPRAQLVLAAIMRATGASVFAEVVGLA
jgi:hypothetical protein